MSNEEKQISRSVSIATGEASYDFICKMVKRVKKQCKNLNCKVYKILNDFFGHTVTCTGLLTGQDILRALRTLREETGDFDEVLLAGNTMKEFEDVFLCGMTLDGLKKQLGFKNIKINRNGGYGLVEILAEQK